MADTCHLCGSTVSIAGDEAGAKDGFVCADCENVTCVDCKSIGVGRSSDHCVRCRG